MPDYQANPGTVLQVPVTLDNAAGLAQVRLQLNYDPQVLTLVEISAGPLGAQFDLSHEEVGGVVTMDFVRATPLGAGSGRLAMLGFKVNAGATTDLYSDLAIARFDLGDATGVRNIAAGHTLQTHNGSVKVSVSRNIDNESNGLPDWWELQHNHGKTTTTSYYPDDDPDMGRRGNVATVTNAANHVTRITAYNLHGQPTQIVDRLGAGDALAAGVLYGLLHSDLQAGLRYGTLLAALALTQNGDMVITTEAEMPSLSRQSATLTR